MKNEFINTDNFNQIVDSLKTDLSVNGKPIGNEKDQVGAQESAENSIRADELTAKIVAATAGLEQHTKTSFSHSEPKQSILTKWRLRFAMPMITTVALGAAVFMLTPSANLPVKVVPAGSTQLGASQLSTTQPSTTQPSITDADLTFDELWLTEDEFLFSEEI